MHNEERGENHKFNCTTQSTRKFILLFKVGHDEYYKFTSVVHSGTLQQAHEHSTDVLKCIQATFRSVEAYNAIIYGSELPLRKARKWGFFWGG